MRWAWLVALGLSGCVWSAQDAGDSTGGAQDEAIEVACMAVPDPAPAIAGVAAGDIDAWHDFGRSDPAFVARVMAYAPGQYTTPKIYWAGSVAYAPCSGGKSYPAAMTFVVLP